MIFEGAEVSEKAVNHGGTEKDCGMDASRLRASAVIRSLRTLR